jgi:hypothetical protein
LEEASNIEHPTSNIEVKGIPPERGGSPLQGRWYFIDRRLVGHNEERSQAVDGRWLIVGRKEASRKRDTRLFIDLHSSPRRGISQ